MENRVADFVAGVHATFGHLATSPDELAGFLRAARRFYLEFIGVSDGSTSSEADSELPFWRYLLYYSTLLLDHAAAKADEELELPQDRELAAELSSCWPLLGVLVSSQYTPPHPTSALLPSEHVPSTAAIEVLGYPGNQATSSSMTSPSRPAPPLLSEQSGKLPRPLLHRHPSIMRAVEPVTPDIHYSEDKLNVGTEPLRAHAMSDSSVAPWDGHLDRASGRSLSESTQMTNSSTSTIPSDLPVTPTQESAEPAFSVTGERPYPTSPTMKDDLLSMGLSTPKMQYQQPFSDTGRAASGTIIHGHRSEDAQVLLSDRGDSTAMLIQKPRGNYDLDIEIGGHSVIYDPVKPSELQYHGPKLSQPRSPVSRPAQLEPRVLLADRGDNTAKLVPTPDGTYVLDVSIGGRKLLVHPERPNEVQYHDHKGSVVTQSLLSHEIPAQ